MHQAGTRAMDILDRSRELEDEQPLVSRRALSVFAAMQAIVQVAGVFVILDACFR